jgi:toxin ParE1/3/4
VAGNVAPELGMVHRLYKRPQVDLDLDSIWDFIASDNITAADHVLDRIGEVLDMLMRNPLAGRQRPELARGLRSFPAGNYIVFYLPLDDGIEVVRILSGYLDITPEHME